jgi:hypothetical protein
MSPVAHHGFQDTLLLDALAGDMPATTTRSANSCSLLALSISAASSAGWRATSLQPQFTQLTLPVTAFIFVFLQRNMVREGTAFLLDALVGDNLQPHHR